MNIEIEWILGAIGTLISGSYIFTWICYLSVNGKIREILTNHLMHVEERLSKLESKEKRREEKENEERY